MSSKYIYSLSDKTAKAVPWAFRNADNASFAQYRYRQSEQKNDSQQTKFVKTHQKKSFR